MTPPIPNHKSLSVILPDAMIGRPGRILSPPPSNGSASQFFEHSNFNHTSNKNRSFPMGIFSRTRDIFAANFTDLLNKSEDPAKMIRIIIMEMEETLVEVRASAARTIADKKELTRHILKLDSLEQDWIEKAQLALSKGREDLAKAALVEKRKATEMAEQLRIEVGVLNDALKASEGDIQKLQKKLIDARSRQNALMTRLESAENQVKLRTMYNGDKVREAFSRFDVLERRVDMTEGHADALAIGSEGPLSLGDEIAALAGVDKVDEELEEMKRALAKAQKKGS
jgi:phage shock protein A